jgi:DeoR/GlpR family transcriptional regulator of sugar metabolism
MTEKNGLKIDIRTKKNLELLHRDGQVRVSKLSDELDVSEVTVRNDLAVLENNGFLQRIQGGAVQTVKNYYHYDSLLRNRGNAEVKRQIAYSATTLIKDGETLLINSGTTTLMTAIELSNQKKNLNIVTNSIPVAIEFGVHPSFRVILLGGEINTQYTFTYGKDAQDQLRRYKADKTILSVDGICPESGLTTYHAEEAAIDFLMMERSRETIVVADSRKYKHESFSHISDIERVHYWITDKKLSREEFQEMQNFGVKIVQCE